MSKPNLNVVSQNEFKIEAGVAMPPARNAAKYPFKTMNVGDSFVFAPEHRNTIGGAAHNYGKDHNQKFTIRKISEGYRCWRVS